MTSIRVTYEGNPKYHSKAFFADVKVYDIAKLRDFITDESNNYGMDEVEKILELFDTKRFSDILELHDKYSLYDTVWEQDKVLADDQTTANHEITIFLNK